MISFYPNSIHPADAIRMAIEQEKQSMEFYKKAAEKMDDPGTRKMFEVLSKQEVEHQRILEEELEREIYKDN